MRFQLAIVCCVALPIPRRVGSRLLFSQFTDVLCSLEVHN